MRCCPIVVLVEVLAVSTSKGSPVTVISVSVAATCIVTGYSAACPTVRPTSLTTMRENPLAFTVNVKWPGGRESKVKCPASSVWTVRSKFLVASLTVTVAFWMTAPLGSLTVPRRSAVAAVCAMADTASMRTTSRHITR